MIMDAHAHIFPDKIAARAACNIGQFYDMPMRFDGSVKQLLAVGEQYGISRFLVQSVATTPEQVVAINDFIVRTVKSAPKIFSGFASLHPEMEAPEKELERVIPCGLKGVKLHADFQEFSICSEKAYRIYELCEQQNLPILMHMGDSRFGRSHPKFIPPVLRDFPKLTMICAHFGGWSQWEEVFRYLEGQRVYVDTSSSLYSIVPKQAKELIRFFGEDKVLFGSDYPMWNPGFEITNLRNLGLEPELEAKILYRNICTLLGIGM